MRLAWRITIAFGMVLVLAAVAYVLAIRSLNRAFAGTDLTPVILAAKKAASDLVVAKQLPEQTVLSRGLLDAYQKNPAAFRADAKLFDTWRIAVQVGKAALDNTPTGSWVRSSIDATYLSPDQRTDPWHHSLCLLRRGDMLVVISGGPNAPMSPVCKNIQITENEVARLPRGRLLETPSGNLTLVMDKNSSRS